MITVEGLTRRFGPVTAVEDVSFHLEKGEVVGFLGPNGAGKTTTMRILTGYLPATSGRVEIAGLDVLRQSLAVRAHIGYLPEAVPLYREHRVSEMMEFQARLHGMRRTDYRARIPEVLERVGIAHRTTSLVGRLSRGQRQRVGIAVALLPSPDVLILDEPTSGLDPLQRIEIRSLLGELADAHTVLISSHILPEIEAVCPRVIVINEGRIAADGTQSELVRQLGRASHVRLEAVVGDAGEAARLLGSMPGVARVTDTGRLGIHHGFDVRCDDDLREDVGALAAQKGWALRELSFQRPTLEELFARLALGLDSEDAVADEAQAAEPEPAPASKIESELPTLGTPGDVGRVGKAVYNLNPFDQGAGRDLGTPKVIEAPPTPLEQKREEEERGE
jgi:ABC-2 type transport system ATP-binding protein